MCTVLSWKLHSHPWLHSVHCAACCVAGKNSRGLGRSFRRVPGTHSLAEMNSDGNVEQRCANCAHEAGHYHTSFVFREPGSNNSTISVTTGHFQGYHFFKNKTMYFLRMPLSFWASLFFFFIKILLTLENCDICMSRVCAVISDEDSWYMDCLWQWRLCCSLCIGIVALLMLVINNNFSNLPCGIVCKCYYMYCSKCTVFFFGTLIILLSQ